MATRREAGCSIAIGVVVLAGLTLAAFATPYNWVVLPAIGWFPLLLVAYGVARLFQTRNRGR